MSIQDWKEIIGSLGFPIAVTAFLLVRLDRTLHDLSGVIKQLCDKLAKD